MAKSEIETKSVPVVKSDSLEARKEFDNISSLTDKDFKEMNIINIENENSEQILGAIKTNLDEGNIRDFNLGGVKILRRKRRKGKINQTVNVEYVIHIINTQFMARFNLVLGLFCIFLGIGMFTIHTKLQYLTFNYSNCLNRNDTQQMCNDRLGEDIHSECICEIHFEVENRFEANTYFYYELDPFYQNNRYYSESRDNEQLLGNKLRNNKSTCPPFAYRFGKEIAPCGAIADSLFNDTFKLERQSETEDNSTVWKEVKLIEDELVFHTFSLNFRNPHPEDNLTEAFKDTVKPPHWQYRVEEYGGYEWQKFMSWMTISPLPTTVKLYARIAGGELEAGDYRMLIDYNYPLWTETAKKLVIIANTSFLGHQNYKLIYYFITVGTFVLFVAAIFQFVYSKYDKKTKKLLLEYGIKTRIDYGFTCYRQVND